MGAKANVIQMPSDQFRKRRAVQSPPPSIFLDIARPVVEIVCKEYGFTVKRILKATGRRSGIICEVRHVAMAMIPASTAQIGAFFNGDQSTVTFARNKIADWEDVYPAFKARMDRIRARIKNVKEMI